MNTLKVLLGHALRAEDCLPILLNQLPYLSNVSNFDTSDDSYTVHVKDTKHIGMLCTQLGIRNRSIHLQGQPGVTVTFSDFKIRFLMAVDFKKMEIDEYSEVGALVRMCKNKHEEQKKKQNPSRYQEVVTSVTPALVGVSALEVLFK